MTVHDHAAHAAPTFRAPTRFGDAPTPLGRGFGGCFAPETLMSNLVALESLWLDAREDPAFRAELDDLLVNYAGRATPLSSAPRLSAELGLELWLKREDLLHTGAHKLNNTLGQCLLARRAGKGRVIAETGAGQHGVATATTAARLGLECVVYMGARDAARQAPNVDRMKLLGAEVELVESGSATLRDAVDEAMRAWVSDPGGSHYVLGSALGPHPFPSLVADFQSVIGREARAQVLERTGALPDVAVACVGGGSNAIGLFRGFVEDAEVALVGVEAGGRGVDTDAHAALRVSGRASYGAATDDAALDALRRLARTEGILPALESSHALAWVIENAARLAGQRVLVNVSGRGDKDLRTVMDAGGAA